MDKITPSQRSKNMAAIKCKGNKSTEICMMQILRRHKMNGWRRHWKIEGKPDFCWPKRKIALFVDGCFWHGCPRCYKVPKSNQVFWEKKIAGNRKRDRKVNRILRQNGWSVVRVWECRLKEKRTISRLHKILNEAVQ